MADPKHGELREVPPKTPVIDMVEEVPKVGGILSRIFRALRTPFLMRRRAKQQKQITERWHTPQGQPEREGP